MRKCPVRYAYAITSALLLGGAAATMTLQPHVDAQTAQNDLQSFKSAAPRAGAPISFADMVATLQPAVVNISTTQKVQVQSNPFAGTPFGDLFGGQGDGGNGGGGRPVTRQAESLGSGFIISADGYVVTNNHVIAAGAKGATVESIKVTLTDHREFAAKVVGTDVATDLAVLKIEGAGLPFVKFGDSRKARVGDWVVAIGNPYGLGGTVTAGIISALNRVVVTGPYDKFIQTDASINRGNSGGPLFDLNGEVIGVNSEILSPTGGNIGIGFAKPAEQVAPIIAQLMKGQKIERGYIGVTIQPLSDDIADGFGIPHNRGEVINAVQPGLAADKAGIKPGDVVVKVGDTDVTPDNTLSSLIAAVKPGNKVALTIVRDGKQIVLSPIVAARPSEDQLAALVNGDGEDGQAIPDENAQEASRASLGVTTTALTPQIARSIGAPAGSTGVVVVATDPDSDAAAKGIQRGDLIVSINRQPVASPADVARIVSAAKASGRKSVVLYVNRRGQATFIGVDIN